VVPRRVILSAVLCTVVCFVTESLVQAQQQAAPGTYYNTVKQELKEGKQVSGIWGYPFNRTDVGWGGGSPSCWHALSEVHG
jgi:hypothetical protein